MNGKKLQSYFKDPSSMDDASLVALKQAVEDFPYSGALHSLYMKALQAKESYMLPAQTKRTAIAVWDRAVLKNWFDLKVEKPQATPSKEPSISFDFASLKKEQETKVAATPAAPVKPFETEKPAAKIEQPVAATPAPSASKAPAKDPDDISHLPESVQKAILRSRALRAGKAEEQPSTTATTTAEVKVPAAEVEEISATKIAAPSKPEKQEPLVEKPEIKDVQPVEESPVSVEEVEEVIPEEKPQKEAAPAVQVTEEIEERIMPFSEKASFLDWLNGDSSISVEPIKSDESVQVVEVVDGAYTAPEEEEEGSNEIRKIIRDLPKFDPPKGEVGINVFTMEADEKGKFVTETLAEIYLKQGLIEKAIGAYEVLSLKYPEKSGFFADRIRAIKKEQK